MPVESDSASGSASEKEESEEEAPTKKKPAPKAKPAPNPKVALAAKMAASKSAKAAVAKVPVQKKTTAGGGAGGDDDDDEDDDEDDDSGAIDDDDADADFAESSVAAKKAAPKASPKVKKFAVQSNWQPRPENKVKWTDEEVDELPVITQPKQMFADLTRKADDKSQLRGGSLEGLKLADLASELAGRPIRVATMCSGTESPLLALDMICKALHEQHGVSLNVEHVFSCEIEPFKEAYIERNFAPPLLFRDIRELDRDEATTAYGATRSVPGDVDMLIAGAPRPIAIIQHCCRVRWSSAEPAARTLDCQARHALTILI